MSESEPIVLTPWHTSHPPSHAAIVAALRLPQTHCDGARSVELIETHRAWVFSTHDHAYKLAKSVASHRHDTSSLELRRVACEHELALNRRLGGDVYQGVVPLARQPRGYRVDGRGPPVEWLLAMRRLRRSLMLDVAIAERNVQLDHVNALADVLLVFYGNVAPAPTTGPEYRRRLLADITAKHANLSQPHYAIEQADLRRLVAALRTWIAERAPLLESRADCLVDAHGDLRPEHICLEPRPVIIDSLEFDQELRRLDPASELAFLALECRRLGAPWIGASLLSQLALPLRIESNDLIHFYQGYHALVRAAVAIWHLDDSEQNDPERWRRRAASYLRVGLAQAEVALRARVA
jgi:aminoglycoside phosphotransferase family enzyme